MEERSREDCEKIIDEMSQKYRQYIKDISKKLDYSSIEKLFEIMTEINNDERDYIRKFPEGLNNLSHEDTMLDFYEVKNKLAEVFVKACSNLSKEEVDKLSKEHPASYIIRENHGHVINDKMLISLDDDNYFTLFPSRIDSKEAITKFVQEYVFENNPIISGERTVGEISGAYDLRKIVEEVKWNIEKDIQYCSDQDIEYYIQECCEKRFSSDINEKRNAELMLSVLQNIALSDQGVPMPSDVDVANIILSYDKGEIDLKTMIFKLANVTNLLHELYTTEEIMNVMRSIRRRGKETS